MRRCTGLRTGTQTRAFLLRAIQEGKKRRKRLLTFLYAVVARKFVLNLCIIGLLLSLSRKIATPLYNRSWRRLERNVGWFDMIWTNYSDAVALKKPSESNVQHFSLYCNALDTSWIEIL